MHAKLDIAYLIKSLVTVGCSCRIYICLFAEPIKAVFFLWGWQPTALISIASWLGSTLGIASVNLHESDIQYSNNNITVNHLNTSTNSLNETDIENWVSFESYSEVADNNVTFTAEEIRMVCYLSSSFTNFGINCIVLFTATTNVIRQVYIIIIIFICF